jgi:glycosyltransferase involved in cell wall biosynthesis
LIQHEQTGILLDELNAENVAGAVDRLVCDSSLRENLINKADLFSRKFDGQEQLKQITDIYEKLCS